MTVVRLRAEPSVTAAFIAATNGGHAEITRQFWAWYTHQPGARLPRRPPAAQPAD